VHISFVRSVQMDACKVSEVKRMEAGGNAAWKAFWLADVDGGGAAAWDRAPIRARYEGVVGDEYKERLGALVEGREFVPPTREKKVPGPAFAAGRAAAPSGLGSGRGTPARTASPAAGGGNGGRKVQNEAYFAKMGAANAGRPDGLAPSQGGKFAGFGGGGGSYEPQGGAKAASSEGIPGVDELTADPVAALTKGFGWFTATVGKQAKSVNEAYIQPGMQKVRLHIPGPFLSLRLSACCLRRKCSPLHYGPRFTCVQCQPLHFYCPGTSPHSAASTTSPCLVICPLCPLYRIIIPSPAPPNLSQRLPLILHLLG